VLDGDEVRSHLSSELGYSEKHRKLNIRRVAYVAREVTRHRGVAICALIAPFADARQYAREIISEVGGFIEIHVSTSLAVCEARDRKGLYVRARAGVLTDFTGIDSPYEAPTSPELRIDGGNVSVENAVATILSYLRDKQYLAGNRTSPTPPEPNHAD